MKFDVRKENNDPITEIIFHDGSSNGLAYGNRLEKRSSGFIESDYVRICDPHSNFIIIENWEHARNFILALEKAKSIGWLK